MSTRTNPAKVKRAAAHPERPGSDCKADPGAFRPLIDFRRCEGKRDCIEVCPYDVFEVRRIDDADFAPLPLKAKLKQIVHGRQVAYALRADQCRACGLCVVACPQGAIILSATTPKRSALAYP